MHGQLNGVGISFMITTQMLTVPQSNVLMDKNGNAYLADFGFLPVVLEFRVAPYLSTTIGGSVRWAAPELFEIPDAANAPPLQLTMHSDIYSFGSIMLQVSSSSHVACRETDPCTGALR
jgi:serine/threonine protein kinase